MVSGAHMARRTRRAVTHSTHGCGEWHDGSEDEVGLARF